MPSHVHASLSDKQAETLVAEVKKVHAVLRKNVFHVKDANGRSYIGFFHEFRA